MKVELFLYASLKNYLPEGDGKKVLEVEEGTTVEGLLNKLRIPPGFPKIIFLNGVHARGNEVLKDGDRVGAFPPVAGG
jgi:molybdopterin synthase sulfur carrier subunit